MNRTLEFYNKHAEDYFNKTINTNMADKYEKFLKYIPKESHILDVGCGSGRDSKYFLDNGYNVTAIDGSKKLSELASEYIGKKVSNIDFLEINSVSSYEGVWACASLLHLTVSEIEKVLEKIKLSLKDNGILYLSFKIGKNFTEYDNDRLFTYFTEKNLLSLINKFEFDILEKWISEDLLSRDIKWINIVLKRQ